MSVSSALAPLFAENIKYFPSHGGKCDYGDICLKNSLSYPIKPITNNHQFSLATITKWFVGKYACCQNW